MSDRNNSRVLRLGEDLPPHHLANLINRVKAHSDFIRSLDLKYPDPEDPQVNFITDLTGMQLFPGLHPALADTQYDYYHGRGRKNRNRGRGQQGRGQQGRGKKGGGRRPQFPDPKMVYGEIARMYQGMPLAGNSGNIVTGETNLEFWDITKAKFFEDAANEVVKHFHIMFCEEVAKDGLEYTAKVAGYTAYVSVENNRHQAVGFLVHPRLKVLADPIEISSLGTVQGIPDLRPGWALLCEDTVSGEVFLFIVLHLKSMRGGPKVTSVVRYKQLQLLVQDLPNVISQVAHLLPSGKKLGVLVGGDMNFPLIDPNFQDGDPLYQAGFVLIAPNDKQGTQIIGSRIDGFFMRDITVGVDFYHVFAYFLNPKLGRSFTDHGTLKVELLVASKSSTASIAAGGRSDGDGDNGDAASNAVGGVDLPDVVLRYQRGSRLPVKR